MGHNRSGVRHVQRKKRHKREQERLALKAIGEAAKANPTATAPEKK
jgi:hypothetical protein